MHLLKRKVHYYNYIIQGRRYWPGRLSSCQAKVSPTIKKIVVINQATTMRLLVSHQPPASYFCQPHVHSLFYYLHLIAIIVLLCMKVAAINSRKVLLPWKIVESHSETDTICKFFFQLSLGSNAGWTINSHGGANGEF